MTCSECMQLLCTGGGLLHAAVHHAFTPQQRQAAVSMTGSTKGCVHAAQVENMAQACWPGDPSGEAGIVQISFAVRGEALEVPPPLAPAPAEQQQQQQQPRQEVAIGA